MSYASMHAWKATYSHSFATVLPSRPPHVAKERPWTPSTHKSFYQRTFPSQHKLAKKRTTMASTQPNPKPPHQKQKSRTKIKTLPTLRTVPKTSNFVDPPDGAVGALCFSHNISPCHGLRLLQVPAGPYLSRGRGVGILHKGFGVRLGEVVVWCDFVGWGW